MIRMSVVRTMRGWFSTLPLFWQIFVPNGIVLVVAAAVLALSPASVPSEISTAQALELVGAVALMVLVNLVLIRHAVKPLERLTQVMAKVDPLEPGQRAPADGGSPEATRLAAVFNEMLDRLETERRDSAAKMLSAQERERIRLARELHDEIGQSVTGLMLELDRAAGRAPDELAVELRETQEVARAISSEVREIVRRLRPEALDDLGLKSADRRPHREVRRTELDYRRAPDRARAAAALRGRRAGRLSRRPGVPDERGAPRRSNRRHAGAGLGGRRGRAAGHATMASAPPRHNRAAASRACASGRCCRGEAGIRPWPGRGRCGDAASAARGQR